MKEINKDIEEKFVKKFIISEKQDRIIHELFSGKKRYNGIQKLMSYVNEQNIIFCTNKISEDEILIEISKLADLKLPCYIIQDRSNYDGKILNFDEAFRIIMDDCVDGIIICGDIVFMKEEVHFGAPSKWLLYSK